VIPDVIIVGKTEASRILCQMDWREKIKHVCSIGEVQTRRPNGYKQVRGNKLRLEFDDIEREKMPSGYTGCTQEHIDQTVAWCARVTADPQPTLIHCAAGQRRSTAVALLLLATLLGPGNEAQAVAHLHEAVQSACARKLRAFPQMQPNRRVVWMGDAALGRKGLLFHALIEGFPEGTFRPGFVP
jgi:predicted protein tyrosine phosphatase